MWLFRSLSSLKCEEILLDTTALVWKEMEINVNLKVLSCKIVWKWEKENLWVCKALADSRSLHWTCKMKGSNLSVTIPSSFDMPSDLFSTFSLWSWIEASRSFQASSGSTLSWLTRIHPQPFFRLTSTLPCSEIKVLITHFVIVEENGSVGRTVVVWDAYLFKQYY